MERIFPVRITPSYNVPNYRAPSYHWKLYTYIYNEVSSIKVIITWFCFVLPCLFQYLVEKVMIIIFIYNSNSLISQSCHISVLSISRTLIQTTIIIINFVINNDEWFRYFSVYWEATCCVVWDGIPYWSVLCWKVLMKFDPNHEYPWIFWTGFGKT